MDGQAIPSPASPAGPPGQPQSGSSPVTGPLANRGREAGALAKLGLLVRQLEQIAPDLGAGNEAGREVYKAIQMLAKHVPPGSASPGIEMQAFQKLQSTAQQQAPMIAAMRAGQAPAPAAAAA